MTAVGTDRTRDMPGEPVLTIHDRMSLAAMASLCVYAIVINLGTLRNPNTPVFTDTPAFLRVVELLAGKYTSHDLPFRIEYPIYPYLVWIFGFFTKDMLFAARLASFVPSALTPIFVYLSCRLIGCGQRASWFGGLLIASVPPLIQMSGVPLYDSLFVCITAVALTACMWALKKPALSRFAVAALICGIAAATRGPGLSYVFALIIPLIWVKDLSKEAKLARAALCLVVAIGCLFVARLPVKHLSAGMRDTHEVCTKQLIQDGIFYANGNKLRDLEVYGLDETGTVMGSKAASVCTMTWPEFAKVYGKDWVKMIFKNWKRTFLELPAVLFPFIILFFPVSLGIYTMLKAKLSPQGAVIVCLAAPLFVIVPMIQWQDRYFYPLFVVFSVIAGLGVQFALDSLQRVGRMVAVALVVLTFGVGVDAGRQGASQPGTWGNYRAACEWILASADFGPASTVMAREHGVYAFLHKETVPMPIASLDKTLLFARTNGVNAIIVGPSERTHNPNIETPTSELEQVKVFGDGDFRVEVLALKPALSQPTQ